MQNKRLSKPAKQKAIIGDNEEDPLTFVYAVRARFGDDTYYKVGFSKNPHYRVKSIQTGCPVEVECAWVTNACKLVERKTHFILAKFNTYGEWFNCPLEQVKKAVSFAKGNTFVKPCHQFKTEEGKAKEVSDRARDAERKRTRKTRLKKFKAAQLS